MSEILVKYFSYIFIFMPFMFSKHFESTELSTSLMGTLKTVPLTVLLTVYLFISG